MEAVTNIFFKIRKAVFKVAGIIITFIYNALFSRFVSAWAYEGMVKLMDKDLPKIKSVLDVGIGTGLSLYKVVDRFEKDTTVLGVDINELYVQQTKKLFKDKPNVEIRKEDFYKFQSQKKFDLIILGFSFMLMPNPQKALLHAQQMLAPGGKIVFLLTMHKNKNWLMDIIKPWFKYITTIDFGRMTYQDQFLGLLDEFNLDVIQKTKLGDRLFSTQILFRFFNVWVFVTEMKKNAQLKQVS